MSSGLNRPLQCGEFRQIWRQQRGKNIPPNSLINFAVFDRLNSAFGQRAPLQHGEGCQHEIL